MSQEVEPLGPISEARIEHARSFPSALRVARRAMTRKCPADVYGDVVYLTFVALCVRAHGGLGVACSTHLIAALRQLRAQYVIATADGEDEAAAYVLAAIRHLERRS